MQERLLHKQQALRAGIQLSEARTRQRSEEDAFGVVRQYDLILGFLQKLKPLLAEYPELHMFYFPVQSEQLLCVYRTADMPQAVRLELRTYQINTLVQARQLFDEAVDASFLSSYHSPLDIRNYPDEPRHKVLDLICTILGGRLPSSYPKGATSLVIPSSIAELLTTASRRLRDLSGLLILFGDEQNFSLTSHSSLAEAVKREFNKYLEETGQYAIQELDFFLASLMNQDERLQDNQNRQLGIIANMVVHRFKNFRQVAEFIAQEFPTAEQVVSDSQRYEDKIRDMQTQLNSAQRLEKQLQYIGLASQKTRLLIDELVDIFEYVYDDMQKRSSSSIHLDVDIPDDFRTQYVLSPPQPIIEEVFYNHLENIFKKIDRPGVENKKLTLQILFSEENFVCLDLITYGPPISPDILEDLQLFVRVRRPTGSGLGMFLSKMIMLSVGGDQLVTSPLPGSDKGVGITLKFPRP
jgi:signal transduction histidine kinase